MSRCRNVLLAMFAPLLALSTAAVRADLVIPNDYATIQAAINAIINDSSLDRTIVVEPGTYSENIRMSSDITLRGRETARTLLKPAVNSLPLITIASSNNNTIQNFTLLDATIGIQTGNSNNIRIVSNVFDIGRGGIGIDIPDQSDVDIINNTFYRNATAISRTVDSVLIQNNIFADNSTAILSDQTAANITENCFYSNNVNGPTGSNPELDSNPSFVNTAARDFHLQQGSACIDKGNGVDTIDGSSADMGAYGGAYADPVPFPIQGIVATDVTASFGNPAIQLNWSANNAYLISNTDATKQGGYKVHYDSDRSGPPYGGTAAGGGAAPSPIDVGNVTSYTLTDLTTTSTLPDAPVLAAITPRNGAMLVEWSAVPGANDYTIHYGIADTGEQSVATGNVTAYTLTGLQNGTAYKVSVSATAQTVYYLSVTAYDSTGDTSHQSVAVNEASTALGAAQESLESNELTGIPELIIPFPLLPDEGCFIATAAYGYYSAPEVQALRNFRDRYLLTNAAGRRFVAWYYTNSPAAAAYIKAHPAVQKIVRIALAPLVAISLFLTETANATKIAVFALLFGMLLAWRWQRRRLL